MSKAPKKPDAKKSKDVKGKTVSAEKQQNTTYLDIVPGKFNENDWNNLLEIDENQEFIWELLDECIENANKVIYTNYLDQQTIPFTINEAKKAILHLIDWQFLDDDTDDDLTENWNQDAEPEACMIDSWAQGYVQTIVLEPPVVEKNIIEEVDEQKSGGSFLEELTQTPNDKVHILESLPVDSSSSHTVKDTLNSRTTSGNTKQMSKKSVGIAAIGGAKTRSRKYLSNKKFSESVSINQGIPSSSKPDHSMFSFDEKVSVKKELPIHSKFKQIDAETKKMEDSIVKAPNACQSLLKTLLTRPVGQREVEIDPFGDISSIAKLDFDKTHQVGIKTRFAVNDNIKNDSKDLNSRRSRVEREDGKSSKTAVQSMTSFDRSVDNRKNFQKSPRRLKPKVTEIQEEEEELILDPVPGVVFTMLNSVRVGPKKALVPNRQQTLYDKSEIFLKPVKPLERNDSLTRMSLEEILESNHEISSIKKQSKLKPMPPISHSIQQH